MFAWCSELQPTLRVKLQNQPLVVALSMKMIDEFGDGLARGS